MHQSLLNQFRGAYLGAALGDVFNASLPGPSNGQDPPLPLGAIALAYTKQLLGVSPPQAIQGVRWAADQSTPLQAMAIQVALCLPTAVYFHDDLSEFQRQLTEQRRLWAPDPVDDAALDTQSLTDGLLMLALVMANILQQHFDPLTAIAPLRHTLNAMECSPLLIQYLACVEEQIAQRHPMAIARLQLESISSVDSPAHGVLLALALALYIALSSSTDLPLTLCRTQSPVIQTHSPLSLPLPWTLQRLIRFVAGMIVGAYNGLEGIPLRWRHCLTPGSYCQAQPVPVDVLETYWNIGSEIELLQLVDPLFAKWSGADEFSRFLSTAPLLAIASPAPLSRPPWGDRP